MFEIPFLQDNEPFPSATSANEEGIVCFGGNLKPQTLLSAYRSGIFPWFSQGDPILWWSPTPRCIMLPSEFIIRKSLAKRIRNGGFEIRFDYDFKATIQGCREVNNRDKIGTWISPEMIKAYVKLHEMGYAHSIECYIDDELVGGLYGLSLGSAFFGESMFSKVSDASKVAYSALAEFAKQKGFIFIDCQVPNDHLLSLGAICVTRELFLEMLEDSAKSDTLKGSWAEA